MKFVRQISLAYRDDRSDKVYEVDLCEVGGEQFVVNFRYGRRGTTLRDGTKTSLPVPRDKAETIYDRLVRSKLKKGYVEVGAGGAAGTAPGGSAPGETARPAEAPPAGEDPRAAAILARLAKRRDDWPLSRAVWRAGELRLSAAVPRLVELLDGKADPMLQTSLVWALVRCAAPAHPEVADLLDGVARSPKAAPPAARLAAVGAVRLASDEVRRERLAGTAAGLDPEIREAVAGGRAGELRRAVDAHLDGAPPERFGLLISLYLLGGAGTGASGEMPAAREVLLDVLRDAPLRPPWFRAVRHLFKLAEAFDDHELYGLLAFRFDTTQAFFPSPQWGDSVWIDGQWMHVAKETRKNDARLAYSSRTREYLRRRVVRRLRRHGNDGDHGAYVRCAAAILLLFSDGQAAKPWARRVDHWGDNWQSMTTTLLSYGPWAAYRILNAILYGNSARYQPPRGTSTSWRCRDGVSGSTPAPPEREEAFPEAWDRHPEVLLRLLLESACEPVHELAVKALRENSAFGAGLDVQALVRLLASPYDVTVRFAFELAEQRHDPANPDPHLAAALLGTDLEEARDLARGWVDADRAAYFRDVDFSLAAITSEHPDVRTWARSALSAAALPGSELEPILGRAIAWLMGLDPESAGSERVGDVCVTLTAAFPALLRELGLAIVADLVNHPMPEVQGLAGRILVGHATPARELPQALLRALLAADSPEARGFGMQLFGELPEAVLRERREVLLAGALSPHADLRRAVRPVLAKLAAADRETGIELARELILFLLRKEPHQGLHDDVVELLRDSLGHLLDGFDRDTVWLLIQARAGAAHTLAAELLPRYFDAGDLSYEVLARLGDHESLALRQIAWGMYPERLAHLDEEMDAALALLDARWPDSRDAGRSFFEAHGEGRWNPARLVALCDSVRDDVRAFGRQQITRFFREADGPDYLLKLSQHPSLDMQIFATHYVERFAAGHDDRLLELEPYFRTVLSLVHRGRVAKDRVTAFLRAEAARSRPAAELAARLFGRQSATVAAGDKAGSLSALRDLAEAHPDLDLPVTVHPPPLRTSSTEARHAG